MPLDFPNSPTVGATYTGPGGVVWSWDGTKWVNGASTTAFAPIGSPAFTGDPTAPTPAYGDNDTSIATTAFVQAAVAPMTNNVGRNLIHNPLFNVAQRGVGPFTANNVYTADRWLTSFVGGSITVQLFAVGDPSRAQIGDEAAQTQLSFAFAGTAGAGDQASMIHRMESVARTAGKTVTVSFYAIGSVALKFGVSFDQVFGAGGSTAVTVNGQSVTVGTAWSRYSLTFAIPSMAGKTLGTAGTDFTQMVLWGSSGATNNVRSGNVGVQSGTVTLWGVQLEIGSVATPLDKPDPQQDLAKCQRFYQIGRSAIGGYQVTGGYISYATTLHQRMRRTPTVVFTDTGSGNVAAPFVNEAGIASVWIAAVATATGGVSIIGNFTASADL